MDDNSNDRDRGWSMDFNAWWRDLRVAAAFLTRLPIRSEEPAGLAVLARAARCFPLVGLGIGLAGALVYAVGSELALPPLPATVLAVAAVVLLTGALHEDGFADTVDGFGGGRDRDHKLRIMRDSRIGTYGVIALVFALGAQTAALSAMAESSDVAAALMLGHAVSRALLVAVMHLEPPARSDGLAVSAGRPSQPTTLWALGIGGIVALIFAGFDGIVASAIGAGVAWAIARLARQQIGGITGDVLGAAVEVNLLVLLVVASL